MRFYHADRAARYLSKINLLDNGKLMYLLKQNIIYEAHEENHIDHQSLHVSRSVKKVNN